MSDDRSTTAAGQSGCDIDILTSDSAFETFDAPSVVRLAVVHALRAAITLPPDAAIPAISVELAGDDRVADLNIRFRGKDGPTNVLSFPAYERDELPFAFRTAPREYPMLLGDIIIAYGVMAREAASEGKTKADHLAHLIVHGMLHCLGFDHVAEEEAQIMEDLERRILATLGINDPYAAREDVS